MQRIFDTLGAFYQLLRLGVITRFDFKGPYWQWRMHTAFGTGAPLSKRELWISVIDYGRWIHVQRRQRSATST